MPRKKLEEWKFQRQLIPVETGDTVTVFVYDRDDSAMGSFPMDREEANQLFGGEDKVYFRGWMRSDGKVVTNARPLKRDW